MGCTSSQENVNAGGSYNTEQNQETVTADRRPDPPQLDYKSTHATGSSSRQYVRQDDFQGVKAISTAGTAEKLWLVHDAAQLFHSLNEYQRVINTELVTAQDRPATEQLNINLTSAFNIVLRFCEVVSNIFNREGYLDEPDEVLAMFSSTLISVMTVRTIIDMYDLILLRSEGLWFVSTESKGAAEQELHGETLLKFDSQRLRELSRQIETMDFHVVHINTVCEKLRDVLRLISQDALTSRSIYVSQNEAIEKILSAAESTRQQIGRLRSSIYSSSAF